MATQVKSPGFVSFLSLFCSTVYETPSPKLILVHSMRVGKICLTSGTEIIRSSSLSHGKHVVARLTVGSSILLFLGWEPIESLSDEVSDDQGDSESSHPSSSLSEGLLDAVIFSLALCGAKGS